MGQPTSNSPRRRRRRRILLGVLVILVPFTAWSCFPGPIRDLWPPRPGEPCRTVDVVLWDWHTFIVEPREETAPGEGEAGKPTTLADTEGKNIQWGFCEKAWYLDGEQGLDGCCRALLWPSSSGVQRREFSRPHGLRHPDREASRWTFVISEKGLAAMHKYLEAERGEPLARHSGWYAGESSYHLFYNCHHFTAAALREAGLPIRPWWAFTDWLVEIQLDRIQRFHEAAGIATNEDSGAGAGSGAKSVESEVR